MHFQLQASSEKNTIRLCANQQKMCAFFLLSVNIPSNVICRHFLYYFIVLLLMYYRFYIDCVVAISEHVRRLTFVNNLHCKINSRHNF